MTSRAEMLRAELAVAELEEQLVAAKGDGADTNELALQLRDARAAHRVMREAEQSEEATE